MEEIGPHVGNSTHGHAARRAALQHEAVRLRPLLADEVLCGRDDVLEGVGFVEELSRLVPAAAHLAATAHVCDGVHNSAVQQRQALAAEARRVDDAIRAVRVQQQRGTTLRLDHVLVVHQANWHLQPLTAVHDRETSAG